MIRNWKMLTLMSLLSVAAIGVMPPPTLLAQEKEPAKIEGLDKLQKAIEALDKKVVELQKSTADKDTIALAIRAEVKALADGMLKDLAADIAAVRAEQKKQEKALEDHRMLVMLLSAKVDGLQGKSPPAADKAFMDEMKKSIKNLEDAVVKLGPTKERTSFAAPSNGNGAPKKGNVKLVNNFSTELVFSINGRGYNVRSGEMLIVRDVPAGPLTYQVMDAFGLLERQVTTLSDGQTFMVTAR